ncbi:aspartate/glutamate racemase family protein [Zwartia sp.]|uniref:maleate cis-trans isomerase family protein n=1 Tax=Zwartia sp. TaxID=2978004 RepID=UPI00272735C0|nr:aspartate/glutamate racemase family protein [Zwartia sp.]MDO9025389.1 aspartate/glutamate racemase family protein [Zwartia sp.]
MEKVIRIGVLTPSSNTALEPLTNAIVSSLPNVHAHFARFRVTNISLSDQALGQFDDSNILAAAEMLADAKPDVITWSGTSAGWMGFEKDMVLCERITARTGIPASTAVLALNELIALKNIKRLGIVSPYTEDVQQKIVRQYGEAGIEVVGEVHHDISVNYDFALVEPKTIEQDLLTVSQSKPEAIVTYCTNLRAAQLADEFERQSSVVLLDTVSTTVWGALRKVGVDPSQIKGWGKLFSWV